MKEKEAVPIKVGVLGSKGRMGQTTAAAIAAADGLELVAQIDIEDSLDLLISSGVDVIGNLQSTMESALLLVPLALMMPNWQQSRIGWQLTQQLAP